MMTLKEALSAIGEAEALEGFPEQYRETVLDYSDDDLSLDPVTVRYNARYCSLPDELADRMAEAARRTSAIPAMALLAKFFFRLRFQTLPAAPTPRLRFHMLGDDADLLMLVISSGFVPLLKKLHRKNGVPEEITKATCSQVRDYCRAHMEGRGRPGIYPGPFWWLSCYVDPSLLYLRFGRLEYMTKTMYLSSRVLRERRSGELLVFAGDGIPFDQAGFALTQNPDAEKTAFVSHYTETEQEISGNTVDRSGRTMAQPVTILKKDYEWVLKAGDPVLDMHIPSGGGMSPEKTEASLKAAKAFYSALPDAERRPRAIVCHSWIFNPNLPEILPQDANLNRFLRRVHPVPTPSGKEDGLWFVFLHEGAFRAGTARRETSLQKAILNYIENGGRWRIGAMFLPMDEIS